MFDVKKKIEAEYETNPGPDSQKLVYSGKLLQDDQRLSEFLRFEDECSVFTIHLVCRLVNPTKPHGDGLRNRKHKSESGQLQSGPSEPTTSEAQDLEAIQALFNNLALQGGAVPGASQGDIQQYQALYSQYMNLYTQYMQSNPPVQQQELPHPPQQDQEPRPAAAAAAAADPAEEQANNNDLLDYAYAIIRVVILFCIMYVHSSFFRLLFVAGGIMFAYMLQNRAQREQRGIQPPPPAPAIPGDDRQETDQPEDLQVDGEEDDSEQLREPKPNLIMVAFTFVTTLFSSIIPDQNHVN